MVNPYIIIYTELTKDSHNKTASYMLIKRKIYYPTILGLILSLFIPHSMADENTQYFEELFSTNVVVTDSETITLGSAQPFSSK